MVEVVALHPLRGARLIGMFFLGLVFFGIGVFLFTEGALPLGVFFAFFGIFPVVWSFYVARKVSRISRGIRVDGDVIYLPDKGCLGELIVKEVYYKGKTEIRTTFRPLRYVETVSLDDMDCCVLSPKYLQCKAVQLGTHAPVYVFLLRPVSSVTLEENTAEIFDSGVTASVSLSTSGKTVYVTLSLMGDGNVRGARAELVPLEDDLASLEVVSVDRSNHTVSEHVEIPSVSEPVIIIMHSEKPLAVLREVEKILSLRLPFYAYGRRISLKLTLDIPFSVDKHAYVPLIPKPEGSETGKVF